MTLHLVVCCVFIGNFILSTRGDQTPLNEALDPLNELNHEVLPSHEHEKRTILKPSKKWAKHFVLHPSGLKQVIGYSPVQLRTVPVIKPLKLHPLRVPPLLLRPLLPLRPAQPWKPLQKPHFVQKPHVKPPIHVLLPPKHHPVVPQNHHDVHLDPALHIEPQGTHVDLIPHEHHHIHHDHIVPPLVPPIHHHLYDGHHDLGHNHVSVGPFHHIHVGKSHGYHFDTVHSVVPLHNHGHVDEHHLHVPQEHHVHVGHPAVRPIVAPAVVPPQVVVPQPALFPAGTFLQTIPQTTLLRPVLPPANPPPAVPLPQPGTTFLRPVTFVQLQKPQAVPEPQGFRFNVVPQPNNFFNPISGFVGTSLGPQNDGTTVEYHGTRHFVPIGPGGQFLVPQNQPNLVPVFNGVQNSFGLVPSNINTAVPPQNDLDFHPHVHVEPNFGQNGELVQQQGQHEVVPGQQQYLEQLQNQQQYQNEAQYQLGQEEYQNQGQYQIQPYQGQEQYQDQQYQGQQYQGQQYQGQEYQQGQNFKAQHVQNLFAQQNQYDQNYLQKRQDDGTFRPSPRLIMVPEDENRIKRQENVTELAFKEKGSKKE